jgi:ATP/maltotriose-dependent transcriptional regulator MalT
MLATRVAPPLPLARLRAAGLLDEVPDAELRFNRDEADALLRSLRCELTGDELDRVERHTEGWAVALRLSASALTRGDRESQLERLSGNPAVTEYLMQEVFEQQSPELQRFLLYTALPERFDAQLAVALLDDPGADALLRQMQQANLLLQPVDHEDTWYRYHHLFSEFLRGRLQRERPQQLPVLHGRAARSFAERDLQDEAIHHAQCAGDGNLLLLLIARWSSQRLLRIEARTLLEWVDALPEALREKAPWVLVLQASALLLLGRVSDSRRVAARCREVFDRTRGERVLHREIIMRGDDSVEAAGRALNEGLVVL